MPPMPVRADPRAGQAAQPPQKQRAYQEADKPTAADPRLEPWIKRKQAARRDRAKYEHVWHLCQAFVQGHQWVGWDPKERQIIELDNPDDRVRHTINVITQHVQTQQGKLILDDARPDLTFRREDVESEMYARQARRAYEYGWDEEFDADVAYWRASFKRLTYGIGAIRVKTDPDWGQWRDYVPIDAAGEPILDEEQLAQLEQTGALPDGTLPRYKRLREGRVVWEPLGPFNLLPPPGIEHEADFPWLIIEGPVSLNELQMTYEDGAAGLVAENIRNVDTTGTKGKQSGQLEDHAVVFTGYELPCPKYPDGLTVVWAQDKVLSWKEELPIELAGQPHHGVRFFKYLPVDGRFWPVGLVQPCVGPQQQRNEMRSLALEIIQRGGFPWLMAHKNVITEKNKPDGVPFFVMELQPGSEFPQPVQGIGPGNWIRDEVDMIDNDFRQVTGTGDVSLSQTPQGVSAYAAFALLVEQDDRRIGPIRKSDRKEIAWLAKYSLVLMRKTWWPDKWIATEGEDGLMDGFVFNAAKLPPTIYTKFSDSAPLPQSQAAEAQKITDVYDRSISGGQTLPLDWLVDSLNGGKMLPLPKREMQVQQDKAEMENLLIAQGRLDLVIVQPYDNDQLHVHYHRACQAAYATLPGYEMIHQLLEQHIQQHLMSAESKAMQAPPTNNGQTAAPGQGVGGQNAGLGPGAATLSLGAGLNQ